MKFAYLHVEYTRYPDGTPDTIQAEGGNLHIITVLQPNTEGCQERGPSHLEGQSSNIFRYVTLIYLRDFTRPRDNTMNFLNPFWLVDRFHSNAQQIYFSRREKKYKETMA